MALMRRSPTSLLEDFNRRMENLLGEGNGTGELSTWRPRTDVYQDGDELVFEVEAPGIARDDLDVSIEGNRLTLSGERREEKDVEEGDRNYYRSERFYGSFQRSYTLPGEVDPGDVEAQFDNGILTVRVPRPHGVGQHSIEIE